MTEEAEKLEARVKALEAEVAELRKALQALQTSKLQSQADIQGIRQIMDHNRMRPLVRR